MSLKIITKQFLLNYKTNKFATLIFIKLGMSKWEYNI